MRKKRIKKLKGLKEERRKRKLYEYEDEEEYEDEDEEEYEDEEDSRLEELKEYLDDVEEDAKWLLKKVEKAVEVHKDKDWEIVELDRDEFAIWYGGFEGIDEDILTGEEVIKCVKGIVEYIQYFCEDTYDSLKDEDVLDELYDAFNDYDVIGELRWEVDVDKGYIFIESVYYDSIDSRTWSGSVTLQVID